MKRRGLIRITRKTWRRFWDPHPNDDYSSFYSATNIRWQLTRLHCLVLYGTACLKCGEQWPDVEIHVDHVIPRSWHSGKDHEYDGRRCQPLCRDHNKEKGAKSMDDYRPAWARARWPVSAHWHY